MPEWVAQSVLYDSIGTGYAEHRQPDPRIFTGLRRGLGSRQIISASAAPVMIDGPAEKAGCAAVSLS